MNKKVILVILGLLAPIFIFFGSLLQNKFRNDVIRRNNPIKVVLTDVDCRGVNHRSILTFRYNGKAHDVKIAPSLCKHFSAGNEIVVYYDAENDYFVFKDNGLENENRTAMIMAVVLFGCMVYWSYGTLKKKK